MMLMMSYFWRDSDLQKDHPTLDKYLQHACVCTRAQRLCLSASLTLTLSLSLPLSLSLFLSSKLSSQSP